MEGGEAGGRLRGLLRDFYGLQDYGEAPTGTEDSPSEGETTVAAGQGSEAAAPPPRPLARGNPLDINSGAFDSKKYLEKQLRRKDIKALIKEDTSLVTSIQDLDSNMKTLVYENYSKFIAAAETLRQMQSHVGGMDLEMSQLRHSVESVSVAAEKVDSAIAPAREKVEKYTRTSQVLEQVRFLVELPTKLQKCIELGAYELAVKYYIGTKPLLCRESGEGEILPALVAVRTKCDEAAKVLETTLRRNLTCDGLPVPKTPAQMRQQQAATTEAAGLLRTLGVPVAEVRKLFLDSRMRRCQSALELATEGSSDSESDALQLCESVFSQTFLTAIATFWRLFCGRKADDALGAEAEAEAFAREFVTAFVAAVNGLLLRFGPFSSDGKVPEHVSMSTVEGVTGAVSTLRAIAQCASDADAQLAAITRGKLLSLSGLLVRDLFTQSAHLCVDVAFKETMDDWTRRELPELTRNAVSQGSSAPSSSEFASLVDAIASRGFIDPVLLAINSLQPLISSNGGKDQAGSDAGLAPLRVGLLAKIFVKVQQVFLSANVSLSQYSDCVPPLLASEDGFSHEDADPRLFLSLSRVAFLFAEQAVPKVVERLQAIIVEENGEADATNLSIQPDDLQERLRLSSTLILRTFARRQALTASGSLVRAVATLPRDGEDDRVKPRGPRTPIAMVADGFRRVSQDLACVLPASISNVNDEGEESSLEELSVTSSPEQVLCWIVSHAARSLREAVRELEDVTPSGVWQLQTDTHSIWHSLEGGEISLDGVGKKLQSSLQESTNVALDICSAEPKPDLLSESELAHLVS